MERLIFSQQSGRPFPSATFGGEPTEGGLREPDALSPRGLSTKSFEKISVLNLGPLTPATKTRLIRLADRLPIGAFHAARELVDERRPVSRAGYAIAVLNAWAREGRYAA